MENENELPEASPEKKADEEIEKEEDALDEKDDAEVE